MVFIKANEIVQSKLFILSIKCPLLFTAWSADTRMKKTNLFLVMQNSMIQVDLSNMKNNFW